MIGILTEKPSAAKNFAKALGGRTGTYNGEQYLITNARGHLYEHEKPEGQVADNLKLKYKSWDLANLPWNEKDFAWKRKQKKGVASLVSGIKSTLSTCDEIVIATDDDPTGEGSLLAWAILDELNLRPKKWSRMYFIDESEKELQRAFKSRKPLTGMTGDPDFLKADYRSKFDYMTMQFTRIATKCGDGRSVLRQGRLKSAMVLIVGDGLKAVNEYKKIPSYSNRFRDENNNVYSNPNEPEFKDKNQVPSTYSSSNVIIDSKTMKKTAPPKLLDLAGLSSILAGKGYKAKDVLATYQKMYEAQIVSYPRTEDKFISPEQFNELLPFIDDIAKVVGADISLLTHRKPRRSHVKTGGAHGANRPGVKVPSNLSALSKFGASGPAIYELLARNYLAMLAEDYEYESQKGHLEKYPDFKGTCSVPKKLGFKAVFNDKDDDDLDDSGTGLGAKADPFVHEGFPPRPPRPTMKWLMKQLEKRDVGTGSTRTSIYADVTNAGAKYPLLSETKGRLDITKYGQMSYLLLRNTNIGDLSMTESLMQDMRGIAEGKLDADKCLAKIQTLVNQDIDTMKRNGVSMRKELGVTMGQVKAKEKCEGTFNGIDISFNKEWGGHTFTEDECEALLAGEEIEINGLISKAGKEYGVKGKLAKQSYKGHTFYGFERTGFAGGGQDSADRYKGKWKGKEVSFKRVFRGYTFSDAECEALLNGDEIEVHGLTSAKGNTYGVYGQLANQTYKGHKYVGFKQNGFVGSKGVPDKWCGHEFTDSEKKQLEDGKSVYLEGCLSKKGNVFACYVSYKEREDGTKGIVPKFD